MMKCLTKLFGLIGLAGAFLLVLAQDAQAYLDPGTGSYILQLLVAVFLGASYALKVYWGQIKAYFSKNQEVEDDNK